MMADTFLYGTPSPKRLKLDDSQQVENDDLSFLDDIDIDEIANCLNNCAETNRESNRDTSVISKSSTSTIKEHGVNTPCSGSSLISENDESDSPKYGSARKDDEKLMHKLEKKMFKLFNQHFISSVIHYGKYSTILKCVDIACNRYAVKILKDKEQKFLGKAKQKMLLQMQMNIPKDNLFCIYFRAGFSLQKHWCFMMEFYPKTLNQAMQQLSKPFHINKVQELARQLVSAVTMLKYNDIVHSDIKPSHILLDSSNDRLRLCGFDDAHYIGAGKTSSNQGTLNYRSPEIILGYSSGFSIDVWSTAIVLVEMATGLVIFPGYSNNDILFRQMCMLGTIPNEMVAKSKYRSQYFTGNVFKRRTGSMKKDIKNKFYVTDKLKKMVLDAQTYYWLKDHEQTQQKRSIKSRNKFLKKVHSFIELIMQMIVIVPEDRFSIDDVYSDPFIYEMFDYLVAREAPPCSYCRESGHRTTSCPKLLAKPVGARRTIARERRSCFSCMERHLQRDCPHQRPCPHCSGPHHEALCWNQSSAPPRGPAGRASPTGLSAPPSERRSSLA